MVTIKKGDVVTAVEVKKGESAKGQYFLCKVKSEKGKDKITIWNNDGFFCGEGDSVKVDEIISVSHKSRKYQEKWYEETDAVCKLTLVGAASKFSEMQDDDSELPF